MKPLGVVFLSEEKVGEVRQPVVAVFYSPWAACCKKGIVGSDGRG